MCTRREGSMIKPVARRRDNYGNTNNDDYTQWTINDYIGSLHLCQMSQNIHVTLLLLLKLIRKFAQQNVMSIIC